MILMGSFASFSLRWRNKTTPTHPPPNATWGLFIISQILPVAFGGGAEGGGGAFAVVLWETEHNCK